MPSNPGSILASAEDDMASDGKLESIILKGAMRGKGRGDKFDWVPIPGHLFVVLGSTIHSINVEYWRVDDEPDSAALAEAAEPPAEDEQQKDSVKDAESDH